jgi:hypothetical protein
MKRAAITVFIMTVSVCALVPSTSAQTGETRTIPLVVMSSTGKVATDVAPRNLRIKGAGASVLRVALDTSPRHIVMLLDISGSMAGTASFSRQTRWDYAKEMAKALLADTPKQDFVALDVFAFKERQIVPFTHDFASIRNAIDDLPEPASKAARTQYKESTAAGDALNSVLLQDGASLEFGDAIVFFSDGEFGDPDETGRNVNSVSDELEQRNIRVFLALALQVGSSGRFDSPDDFNVATIGDSFSFMAETGGFSFVPAMFPPLPVLPVFRLDPINQRIVALSNAIHATYRLQLQVEQPLRKKQKLQLDVVDDQGKPMHNLFLYYPRNLYPE